MFSYLPEIGRELRGELLQMYWVLLTPFIVLLIMLELFKEEGPDIKDLFRRVFVSVLLLYSFDYVVNAIAIVGDSITERIDGLQKLWDVLKNLGPNYNGSSSGLFGLRETAIYLFSVAAYIVAYLGFFVATALIHFVWTILYICSPLMILMFVSKKTAYITVSLYRGLISVITWKILWSLLGVLLLKLALNPQVTGMEDYLMSIVINLCIGVSMLFIPIATKSLLGDGMQAAASALAAAPTMAAATTIKASSIAWAKKTGQAGAKGAAFVAKPATNPITGRYEVLKNKYGPKFNELKKQYAQINLPKELKNYGRYSKNDEQ